MLVILKLFSSLPILNLPTDRILCMMYTIYTTFWFAVSLLSNVNSQGLISRSATGHAIIINKCTFPVYFKACANDDPMPRVLDPNDIYWENYRLNPNGGGISIKISSNQSIRAAKNISIAFASSTLTQFEYTLAPNVPPGLFYDISNVDGGNPWPFQEHGLTLRSSRQNCSNVVCPAGRFRCEEAYTKSSDDWATHDCESEWDLRLYLCSTEKVSMSYFRHTESEICRYQHLVVGED